MENEEVSFIVLMITSGILFLVTVLVISLKFASNKVLKEKLLRQELALKHQQESVEYLIEGQEKERKRLSKELHDSIGSKLNIININIAVLKQSESKEEQIEVVNSILKETMEETRRISYNLMPVTLDKFGINAALEEMTLGLSGTNIKTNFNLNIENGLLTKKYATHVYRIIQELINNSLKHSNCSEINLNLWNDFNYAFLSYSDNGIGSEIELEKVKQGIGLRSMENRTTIMNGSLTVSNNNPGLIFEIKIPLKENND